MLLIYIALIISVIKTVLLQMSSEILAIIYGFLLYMQTKRNLNTVGHGQTINLWQIGGFF